MQPLGVALALGLAAGLALAIPVGPVALLVVSEGLARGFRVGAGAALGVAAIDAAYAALAVTAGGAVAGALDGHRLLVRAIGALVLAAVAARGFRVALATPSTRPGPLPVPGRGSGPVSDLVSGLVPTPRSGPSPAPLERTSPARAFTRFAALTAINPLTALTFVAIAVALGDRLDGPARPAFVAGVAGASAAWQLGLAAAGSLARSRLGPRAQRLFALVGNAGVAVLAGLVAFT